MGANIRITRGTTYVPYSTSASTVDTPISLVYGASAVTAPRWAFVRLLTNNGYVQAVNKDGLYMPQGCTAGDQSAVVSLAQTGGGPISPVIAVRVECGPSTDSWNGGVTQVDRYVPWELWEFMGNLNGPNEFYIPGATWESQPLVDTNNFNYDGGFTLAQAPDCVPFTRGISWTQETAGAGIPGGYTDETRYGAHTLISGDLFGTPLTLVGSSMTAANLHATERATAHFNNVYFKGNNWITTLASTILNNGPGPVGCPALTTPNGWSNTFLIGSHRWGSTSDDDMGLAVTVDYNVTDKINVHMASGETFSNFDQFAYTICENPDAQIYRYDNLTGEKDNLADIPTTWPQTGGRNKTTDLDRRSSTSMRATLL